MIAFCANLIANRSRLPHQETRRTREFADHKGGLMFISNGLGRSFLFAASIAAVLGIAVDAGAAEKVTVTFANWAAAEGTTKPAIDQVIADFERAHPDIQIK